MKKLFPLLIFVLTFYTFLPAEARLEFDSKANNTQIYGPFLKYNFLKQPYYYGRHPLTPDDISLEVQWDSREPDSQAVESMSGTSTPSETQSEEHSNDESIELTENEDQMPSDETPEKKEAQPTQQGRASGKVSQIQAVWPRFLLSFGRIELISKQGRVLFKDKFTETEIGNDEKFARFTLDGEDENLLEALKESFQICLTQEFEESSVKACSNHLQYNQGRFFNAVKKKNAVLAKLNGKKVPTNAHITLPEKMENYDLEIRFRSGFYLQAKDKVHMLTLENVVVDPLEKRIVVISGDGSLRPTQLTLKDRLFSFIKEENYYKKEFNDSQKWPQDLEDAEMEFTPYETAASSQLYGLVMAKIPPPYDFKLNDDIPIATYDTSVQLHGTKSESEVLAAKVENQLYIHKDQKEFIWNFPTPNDGEMNQNYLSLQYKGKDYYFSKRIFRANQTSVSGSVAISTSQTLDIVPGYNFAAEHWFEKIWGTGSWSFQRWGLMANIYETVGAWKPSKSYNQKLSINPINLDLLFRFSPGVRPVQSSFGLGMRFLNYKVFRSIDADIETRLLGVGAFWHTAPQKIIDDVFNIVPFFRYPKWMEISGFYYPLLIGNQQLGFSFSWQAKGKMFFSKHWFVETSFNVNSINFNQPVVRGVTAGYQKLALSSAHGTIGLGYNFN